MVLGLLLIRIQGLSLARKRREGERCVLLCHHPFPLWQLPSLNPTTAIAISFHFFLPTSLSIAVHSSSSACSLQGTLAHPSRRCRSVAALLLLSQVQSSKHPGASDSTEASVYWVLVKLGFGASDIVGSGSKSGLSFQDLGSVNVHLAIWEFRVRPCSCCCMSEFGGWVIC